MFREWVGSLVFRLSTEVRHKSNFCVMSEFNNDTRGEMSDPGKKIVQIKARYL